MGLEQPVQMGNGIHLIVGRAPVESAGFVDVDFLLGQPFDPVGKSKGAIGRKQGA